MSFLLTPWPYSGPFMPLQEHTKLLLSLQVEKIVFAAKLQTTDLYIWGALWREKNFLQLHKCGIKTYLFFQVENEVVICPDKKSACPTGNTCCPLTTGAYACCPLPSVSIQCFI